MTAYRFRVKFDLDPTALWRDVVVGADRTVADLQSAINPAVGLDQDHLWFVGTGEDYWASDVKYVSGEEIDIEPGGEPPPSREPPPPASGGSPPSGEEPADARAAYHDAGETPIAEMVRELGLERYDRICYLYDYGDEWRFYGILKEVLDDEPDDVRAHVVREKGDPVDQYGTPGGPHDQFASPDVEAAGWYPSADADVGDRHPSTDTDGGGRSGPAGGWSSVLPEPLNSLLPGTAVPVSGLRNVEDRDDVVHVLVLHSLETGFGRVADRFAVQLDDAGYVLENFDPGWETVAQVDGEVRSEEELLAALVAAARDWHDEIAEIVTTATGRQFDAETVAAMNDELEAELERKGYGDG